MDNQATLTSPRDRALAIFDRAPVDVRRALANDLASYGDDGSLSRWQSRFGKLVPPDLVDGWHRRDGLRVTCCPIGLLIYQWILLHSADVGVTVNEWIDDYACTSSYRYGKLIASDDLTHRGDAPFKKQSDVSAEAKRFIDGWDADAIPIDDLVAYLRANTD